MKTIDSNTLKKLLISGSNHLYNHYPEVDALNVFPVPDGDTGINMSLTCTSGAQEIAQIDNASTYEVAKKFSHGLLMGARGNSGVITSQIFRGFASYLENVDEINAVNLVSAFKEGSNTAYKAVMRPVEGTILTVIRESSNAATKIVNGKYSIEKALEVLLREARESLKRTPELLPILKEVGVVDSGGTGLCYIIEGMYLASIGKEATREESLKTKTGNVMSKAAEAMDEEEFGYCTEFIMSLGPDSVKKPFDQKSFTNWLNEHGVSLVVVRDEDIVKVHVHTLTPGEILNFAQQYGEFLKLKIENMTEQHHALENGADVEVHKDLVEEENNELSEEYAIVAVSSGKGIDDYFKEIGASYIVGGGQTMNPSSEDFVKAIKATKAKIVYILPNNSNILMAASQAAEMFDEDSGITAYVIPSKTIPQGISACLAFDPDNNDEDNFKNMKASLSNVKSGEVTFAIRDTEIKGVKIAKNDFIGIYQKDIVCGTKDKNDCLKYLLSQMIDDESSLITIILGEDVSREDFFPAKKEIEELYPDVNIELIEGKQPVYSFLVGVI